MKKDFFALLTVMTLVVGLMVRHHRMKYLELERQEAVQEIDDAKIEEAKLKKGTLKQQRGIASIDQSHIFSQFNSLKIKNEQEKNKAKYIRNALGTPSQSGAKNSNQGPKNEGDFVGLDQKLHEFGLIRKSASLESVQSEMTAKYGPDVGKYFAQNLDPGGNYTMIQTDASQPFLSFSRFQTNCPALQSVTDQAALKIGPQGQVLSGIYTRTGASIPQDVLQCTFIVPQLVGKSISVNTLFDPP